MEGKAWQNERRIIGVSMHVMEGMFGKKYLKGMYGIMSRGVNIRLS